MKTSMGLFRTFLFLPSATLLFACSPKSEVGGDFSGYSIRDSAGVTILENSVPAWGADDEWTLTSEPILSIGTVEGAEEYLFHHAVSPLRLEGGRIVVANGGSQELRFYDGEGRFLTAIGEEGEGPGEFRGIGFIHRLAPDSLAVLDYRLFRFSVFDEAGVFIRSFRIGEGSNELPFPDGFFSDGSILASIHDADVGEYNKLGMFRGLTQYRRYDSEGVILQGLVELPGEEYYRGTHPDGSGFTLTPSHAIRPWVTAGPVTWFYSPGHSSEVQEWSPEGDLLRVVRLDRKRRPMPQEMITAREESIQEADPAVAARMRAVPFPKFLPAYEQILLDRSGNLWVSEYVVLDEVPVWQVFDPGGRWLGGVTMPDNGRVSEIGDDYVLGVWRDHLDVETIRMYGLQKPGDR